MSKLKILSLCACLVLIYASDDASSADVNDAAETEPQIELTIVQSSSIHDQKVQVGKKFSLTCQSNVPGQVWWVRHGKRLTASGESLVGSSYEVQQARLEHSGDYTCVVTSDGRTARKTISLTVLETVDEEEQRVTLGSSAAITCQLQGHHLTEIMWEKVGEPNKTESLKAITSNLYHGEDQTTIALNFAKVTYGDNGTYICSAKEDGRTVSSERVLFVIGQPEVKIESVKAVGAGKAYLNWTANGHNEEITEYAIEYQKADGRWEREPTVIDTRNSSFVTSKLEPGKYRFRITATNSLGSAMDTYSEYIDLPESEPNFVPTIKVTKETNTSRTIDISSPPSDMEDYDFYYKVEVTDGANVSRISRSDLNAKAVIIEGLEPNTRYQFRVAACVYYTKDCGDNWSAWINDASMASISSGLHSAGVNFVVGNTVLVYFAVKHLFT